MGQLSFWPPKTVIDMSNRVDEHVVKPESIIY
jgi:hypothetical protein